MIRRDSKLDLAATLALGLCASTATLVVTEGEADAAVAYIRSTVGAPWGESTNEQAMDLVYGVGGWDDLRYETVNPATLYSGTYTFIYMEGSDSNAMELLAFMTANQAALEAWVSGGGTLFLNSGPNEGGNMAWGFGGVTLNNGDFPADPGMAVDPTHPIWNGPFLPTALMFTGSSYAHASVSGAGLIPHIIDSNGGNPNLAELGFGGGLIMFGGLTTSNFWTPAPESLNLRANIIAYLDANASAIDSDMDGVSDNGDNCPMDANPMQEDMDMDGAGDACDACPDDALDDADMDMACDGVDNCLGLANPTQVDDDMDGAGNECDPCPGDPDDDIDGDTICGDADNCPEDLNVNQADTDRDGVGDLCDACIDDPGNDDDGDGVCAADDNCPDVANDDQADADRDGVGDACDEAGESSSGGLDTGPLDSSGGPSDSTGGLDPDTGGTTDSMGSTSGGLTGGPRPGDGTGCACSSGEGNGSGGLPWLMVVAGVALRRRRSSSAGR